MSRPSRRALPAPLALPVALALAAVLPAAAPGAANDVRVFSSGNKSELVKKLPITATAGAKLRKVMRIGPARTPTLRNGDTVRAGVELQLTNSCVHPGRRCVGPTYRFSPKLDGELWLRGPGGLRRRLGSGSETCGQAEPHREHHCVLVIPPRSRTVHPRKPCRRCRLELTVSAHDPLSDGSQRILVGGNRPDGSIPQDRGRISATLVRRGARRVRAGSTDRLRLRRSPTDKKRRVVLSKRLRGLRAGEQLEVDAKLRSTVAHLPYSVRTTAQLVLSRHRSAVVPDRRTKRIAMLGGEIDESNGFNCVLPAGSCVTRKLGVSRVDRGAKRLFVNLVLLTGPKRAKASPGDAVELGPGRIRVRRYPPPKR